MKIFNILFSFLKVYIYSGVAMGNFGCLLSIGDLLQPFPILYFLTYYNTIGTQ